MYITQNKYFDVNFKKSKSESIKIRVMADHDNNHSSFENYLLQKSSVKLLKRLSPKKKKLDKYFSIKK